MYSGEITILKEQSIFPLPHVLCSLKLLSTVVCPPYFSCSVNEHNPNRNHSSKCQVKKERPQISKELCTTLCPPIMSNALPITSFSAFFPYSQTTRCFDLYRQSITVASTKSPWLHCHCLPYASTLPTAAWCGLIKLHRDNPSKLYFCQGEKAIWTPLEMLAIDMTETPPFAFSNFLRRQHMACLSGRLVIY